MKRFRQSTPKNGRLNLRYGRVGSEAPDVHGTWGDGCSKRDLHLLFTYMCSPHSWYMQKDQGPSLMEELEGRGYDLNTLKFSIQKKVEA